MRWIVQVPAALVALSAYFGAVAEAAEVVLYDFFDFGGAAVTLAQSAPDLDAYNFDNDVESIRVISGTWSFHRDDNFQNGNGPPLTLGPGDYPNIEALGFPQDRMSSVQLLIDDPAPVQCGAGEAINPDATACVNCANYGTVPNPAQTACVCPAGAQLVGSSSVQGVPVQQCQYPSLCGPTEIQAGGACVDCAAYGLVAAGDRCTCPAGAQVTGVTVVTGVPLEQCTGQCAGVDQIVAGQGCRQCPGGTIADAGNAACVCRQGWTLTAIDRQTGDHICQAPPQTDPRDEVEQGNCVNPNEIAIAGGCLPCPPNSAPNAAGSQCACQAGLVRLGDAYYGQPDCGPCGYGSVYDAGTGQCICPAGTVQASSDGYGNPQCVQPAAPRQTDAVSVPAGDVYDAARAAGFLFAVGRIDPTFQVGGATFYGYHCAHYGRRITINGTQRHVFSIEGITVSPVPANLIPITSEAACSYTIFGGSLSGGWTFVGFDVSNGYCLNAANASSATIVKTNANDAANMTHRLMIDVAAGDPSFGLCVVDIDTVTLRGPAGGDWRDAFN